MKYEENHVKLKDGSDCVLKIPGPENAAEMLEYLKLVSAETHFMVRFPEEVTMTLQQEVEFLTAQQDNVRSLMISAWLNGELAGNLGISAVSDQRKQRHRATLGIALKKKFWGKGLGNILIREAEAAAKEMGFLQLELGVYADNERAIHLYESLGFENWGRSRNAFRLEDGTFRDEILMGKLLRY